MNPEPNDVEITQFLSRVMEIEEDFAFAKKGHESARKDKLRELLEEFCK